jgi:arabinan endo-1,5-alpha-L-arabinosidase
LDSIQWENSWPVIGCDGTPSAQMTNPVLGGYCDGGGPIADGTYYITNVNSGLYLEVANGSPLQLPY